MRVVLKGTDVVVIGQGHLNGGFSSDDVKLANPSAGSL